MSELTPREWLGLEATHNPHRWYLPVIPRLSVREIFLFGGAGLAAATTALEETTGRPYRKSAAAGCGLAGSGAGGKKSAPL